MARISLLARYLDKLWQGLRRSVLERRLALASVLIALVVQWQSGRLTESSLAEKLTPEAVILWLFVVWHIFKAFFIVNREIRIDIASYTPTIIVPGEPKRDPPDAIPLFTLKLLAFAMLSFLSLSMVSYVAKNLAQYVSSSEEARSASRDSESIAAYSAQVFDKNGDPVPGVVSGPFTINVLPADVSLKDFIRIECPRIMDFIANRLKHAPPHPLLGWLSPTAMRAAVSYESDTSKQFDDGFLPELKTWHDRMAAAGLRDGELDTALANPRDVASMRIIVEKTLTLSRGLPQTVLAYPSNPYIKK